MYDLHCFVFNESFMVWYTGRWWLGFIDDLFLQFACCKAITEAEAHWNDSAHFFLEIVSTGLGGVSLVQGVLPALWGGGVLPAWYIGGGVSLPGPGGVLPAWSGGVSLPGLGGLPAWSGGSPCLVQGGLDDRPPLWTESQTRVKNITLATTSLWPVMTLHTSFLK